MASDTTPMEGRNADDPPLKAGGKARLLTLNGLDRRTAAYRETRKLIDEIESDLGGGERLTTAERQLVQHAAVLGAVLTDVEARWIEGEPIDATAFCTIINAQRRVLETIGLRRRARTVVVPSVAEYITQVASDEEANAA